MSQIAPVPAEDSLIEMDERIPWLRNPLIMARGWIRWLQEAVLLRVQQSPLVLLDNYELLNQHTSILATPFPLATLAAGTYEVEVYVRPTVADGVTSSVAVALGWTENALALSRVVATVAGAPDSVLVSANGRIRVTIDASSPLTFATVYASNTADKMRYKLQFTVKAIGS